MQESTFTIAFPEHASAERVKGCLALIAESGAAIDRLENGAYRVVCSKPKMLAHAGWIIFHTYVAKTCTLLSVTGSATDKASDYPVPKS
jgi:hypothetical protein